MTKVKILTLIVLLSIMFGNVIVFSQEVSEKKEVAVFKLSYYNWSIPNQVLGSIDAQIRNVIVNLGRFKVLAMTYQLGSDDVNTFINKIKEFKEKNVKIPEEVAMGHVVFTEADLNQLIGSFIVIIPSVVYYDLKIIRDENGLFKEYNVSIRTAFSILNVDTMVLEKEILIETSGSDTDKDKAIRDAIDDITGRLEFEIKSVPIFTLKTGVLEVYGRGITLQMGKDMGIKQGFEFVLLEEKVLKSGLKRVNERGLVIVNKVDEEVSEATILYGNPQEGDQLKEIPRVGVESFLYTHLFIENKNNQFALSSLNIGLRATLSLGVYSIRPIAGVEIPINLSTDEDARLNSYLIQLFGIPITAYLGVEYTTYMGRLQISPAVSLAMSGFYNPDSSLADSERYGLTHVGAIGYVQVSYLLNKSVKAAVDLGYSYMFAIDQNAFSNTQGVLIGGGIIIKL